MHLFLCCYEKGGFFDMKKAYLSPELREMWLENSDIVLASGILKATHLGKGDWGYGDDFTG